MSLRKQLALGVAFVATVSAVVLLFFNGHTAPSPRSSRNQMLSLVTAVLSYQEAYHAFPTPPTERDGTPRFSWRVPLLPFATTSYPVEFDLSSAWDSKSNEDAKKITPDCYTVSRER